jgi:hypothetical protein
MRTSILLGAAAFVGLTAANPAFCLQATTTTPSTSQVPPAPGEPMSPDMPNPAPAPDPSQPNPPVTEPLPPEMPMPTGQGQQTPPAPPQPPAAPMPENNPNAPAGQMATPPSEGASTANSGGATDATMQPQGATKAYPLCTKTIQDSCRNPGEGKSAKRRPR